MAAKKKNKKTKPTAATPDESEKAELDRLEKKANEEAAALEKAKGEETPSSESAPDNQTPSEEEKSKPEGTEPIVEGDDTPKPGDSTSEEEGPKDEADIKNLSPKAQKRFKKLNEEAKKGKKAIDELERIKTRQGLPPLDLSKPKTPEGKLPWDGKTEENGEEVLTEEQLQQKIQSGVRQGITAEKQVSTFSKDIKSVEKEYPALDSNSDSFDEDLATKISGYYEAIAFWKTKEGELVFKPSAPSFRTFVDGIMGIRAKAGEKGKKQVTTDVLKQRAKQPVSPSGTPPAKGPKAIVDQIKDPNTSLEEAEVLANKAVKS